MQSEKSDIFNSERIQKVSSIVPQFSKVAEVGDEILLGLEGDPSFPKEYETNRPMGVITNVDKSSLDDILVTAKMSDGQTKTISSTTIRPKDVWEFSDQAFRGVLEREQAKVAPKSKEPTFKGVHETTYRQMKDDITSLRQELMDERANARKFQNVVIASMKEMANDVCVANPNAKFCKAFNEQYDKMMQNRSESSVDNDTVGFFSESDDDEEEDY